MIFSSMDLKKLYEYQLMLVRSIGGILINCSVSAICFDPTNLIIASSINGDVAALSLIENRVKYLYMDVG